MPIGFPTDLEAPFLALWDDVSGLYSRWIILLQLFGSNERIELLNRAAPSLFHAVQQSLGDSVIIAIARLTDPAQTGKRENLTLQRLLLLIPADEHPQLTAELNLRIDVLTTHCEAIRLLRNRKLAHSDLPARLDPTAEPIPDVKRQTIHDALRYIADIVNCIDRYFRNTSTLFDEVVHTGDGETLALLLEIGLSERTNAIRRKLNA